MVDYIRVAVNIKDPYTKVSMIRSVAFKSTDGTSGPYGSIGSMTDLQKDNFVSFIDGKSAYLNQGAYKEMFVPTTNARETLVNVDTSMLAIHDKVFAMNGLTVSPVENTGQKYYVYIYAKNNTGYEFIQPSNVKVI